MIDHVSRALAIGVGSCLGLAFFQAEPLSAATYKVAPVQVTLSAGRPSALLTLSNESDETLRFQISAFAWDAGPHGEMKLEPTTDVTFFPELLSLEPGKERKVRVGVAPRTGGVERTYRIFFQELPPPETSASPSGGSQVRVLTRMGIPIFVTPPAPKESGALESATLAGGVLRFRVHNTGNVHLRLQGVTVHGEDAAGKRVLDTQVEGWYVLAGEARDYEIAMAGAECARLAAVVLEARTDRAQFSLRLQVGPGACTPAEGRTPDATRE